MLIINSISMKKVTYIFSALLLSFTLLGAGCSPTPEDTNTTQPDSQQNQQKESYTMEESKQIAMDWIKNEAPTYKFDGSKLNLKNSEETSGEECTDCFSFTFEFESSHGGYGDRSDKMVTQVITPHEMVVDVEQGEVVSAVTDSKFDEMSGEMMSPKEGNNEDKEESMENEQTKIKLNNVSGGDTISRTATIEGEARGSWYSEGQFSVVVKDTSDKEIGSFVAKAQGEWMTEEFVPFKTELDLSDYSGDAAKLEFQKANPSGMEENAESHTIKVELE